MARFYDAGFTMQTDEERAAQRQQFQDQLAAMGITLPQPTEGPSRQYAGPLTPDGGGQLPTMDFRRGGDPVSPWTPEEALAQLGPTGQFGGYAAPAPVIGEAASGAFPSDQPVSLYERGGGQSGYGGGSTLGGAVGMGGMDGGGAGQHTTPTYGQEVGAGRSWATRPAVGVQGPSGRALPSPFSGSGYSTLGGASGYGRRY